MILQAKSVTVRKPVVTTITPFVFCVQDDLRADKFQLSPHDRYRPEHPHLELSMKINAISSIVLGNSETEIRNNIEKWLIPLDQVGL